MRIYLADIPEEGLELKGTLDRKIFDLDPNDEAQPAGDIRYDLVARVSGDLLTLEGQLSSPFELRCVNCLERFPYTVEIDPYLAAIEIEGSSSIDLTDQLREDILLDLPSYPRCEEGDEPERICQLSGPLSFESASATPPSGKEADSRNPWQALDKLDSPEESA